MNYKIETYCKNCTRVEIVQIKKGTKVSSFRIISRDIVEKILKAKGDYINISMEILKHTNNIGNIAVEQNESGKTRYGLCALIKLLANIYKNYKQ